MRSIHEIKACKELEKEGWRVDTKAGMHRWSKNTDYFHRFDIIAVKKGKSVRWISIKGHAGVPAKHRKEIEDFWLPKNNVKEIWSWGRNRKWKKVIFK